MKKMPLTVITLIMGSVITNLALDMYMPALPSLKNYFGITESVATMTLNANIWGAASAGILYGPLADFYGRKRLLIIGISLFSISTFLCMFAVNVNLLIFARFIQGMGGVASSVIWLTVIKDIFKGRESARIITIFSIVTSLSLSVAPIIGAEINEFIGWRGIFFTLGILSIFLLISILINVPETLPIHQRRPFSFKKLITKYRIIFRNRYFLACGVCVGVTLGSLTGSVSTLSFLFIENIGMSCRTFSIYQFIPTLVTALTGFWSRYYLKNHDLNQAFRLALRLSFSSVIVMILVAFFAPENPMAIALSLCLYCAPTPFIMAVSITRAMEVSPHMGGSASSSLNLIRNSSTALIVTIFSQVYNGTFLSIALGLTGCFLVIGAMFLLKLNK